MLAVSAVYYDDFQSFGPAGSAGGTWANSNTEKGVLVLTIDATGAAGDDLFMRVVNDNYSFATDANFANLLSITTYGYTAPSATPVNPPTTGTAVNPVPATPGSFVSTIGTSIASDYSHSFTLQLTDPTIVALIPPTITPGTSGVRTSRFDTILVTTLGLNDGFDTPTFTIVGSSQDVRKTLIVDLTDDLGNPISGSTITVNAPVTVNAQTAVGVVGSPGGLIAANAIPLPGVTTPTRQAGAIYLQSESIAINAAMTSHNSLSLVSEIGVASKAISSGVAGITVNATVISPETVTVDALGTGFTVNAGGSISNGLNTTTNVYAPSASLTLQLQDADAVIAGNVVALQQSYFLMPTAGDSTAASARTITTRSTSTSTQSGLIAGDLLVVYLANIAGPAAGRDGSFDIQAQINTLRLTSATMTVATALDYDITVANKQSLTLDSLMASKGDIALHAKTNKTDTITLLSVIETLGNLNLTAGGDLTIGTSITSAANVTLSSEFGSVATAAAITTREASTGLGEVIIRALNDVRIGSLVQAEYDGVTITAGRQILSDMNLADKATSRISGTSANLTAASGINLGTDIAALIARVTAAGSVVISDRRDDGKTMSINSITTFDGSIALESVQDINLLEVVAGGSGSITVVSMKGNIDLATVIADSNTVTVIAAEFSDGRGLADWLAGDAEVLHAGYITGVAPTSAEINWTAANVVTDASEPTTTNTDLFRNIPTISAHRLTPGDLEFTADGGVVLKSVVTVDGSVTVDSTYGSLTAQSVVAKLGTTAAAANVTLQVNGDLILGSIIAAGGLVDVTAGQSITDDGIATTVGIISDSITLRAAVNGVATDIGSVATGRVTIASPTITGIVNLTVERAPDDGAVDPGSIFIGASSAVTIAAVAVSVLDVQATGAISDVYVLSVGVSDVAGAIVLVAGRNLSVGSAEVAGGLFGLLSRITLIAANGSILNEDPAEPAQTSLLAYALSLTARSFDGTFSAASLDAITRFTAVATANGGTAIFTFERASDLTLDGVSTQGGSIGVDNIGGGDLRIGTGGVTAGGTGAVRLTTSGGIGEPANPAESPGTVTGSSVTLNASENITAFTKAGQLSAATVGGVIDIRHTGDVVLGDLTADSRNASITLGVTGRILPNAGTVTTTTAVVTATTGIAINTNVKTLSATTTSGNLTVIESDGLHIGQTGIQAIGGTVSLTLTKGTLVGGGKRIAASAVVFRILEDNNDLTVLTSADSIAGSTAFGNIQISNNKSFSVGPAGLVAGKGADVYLQSTGGRITGGPETGRIHANKLYIDAATGISTRTNVASVARATSALGDIVLAQSGQDIAIEYALASKGSVFLNSDASIIVIQVQAIGVRPVVSITTGGMDKVIAIGTDSIRAVGGYVALNATGGIDGASIVDGNIDSLEADIVAARVLLNATGDITTILQTDRVNASAIGTDSDTAMESRLDITLLGTRPVILDAGSGSTLSASGEISLTALHAEDPNIPIDIIVVEGPASDSEIVSLNTPGQVVFAVTDTFFSGLGSLTQAILDASTVVNNFPEGTSGVAFVTTIASPIVLESTINIDSTITLDGTHRINTITGTFSRGRAIDIDGSKLSAQSSGLELSSTADGSTIRGFAFHGFSKTGSAALAVTGSPDDLVENVTLSNNLFGISSTGRPLGNTVGILATYANGLLITGNTVVKSSEVGIQLGAGVMATSITGNFIGTDAARRNLGNTKIGIEITGADGGNSIGGVESAANLVAFNGTGIRIVDTIATSDAVTDIRGNEIFRNATGVAVDGTTAAMVIANNTLTRNAHNGIEIAGSATDVRVGSTVDDDASLVDRNYVGTTATNALGLGNGGNGIVVTSSGTGIAICNNVVFSNGTANKANDKHGIVLSGTDAGTVVTKNILDANRGAGLFATASGRGVLTRNAIRSNYGSGVLVSDGAGIIVGSSSEERSASLIRENANTIFSNLRYGVEVRAAAFTQTVGNSMASNRLGGILNPNLAAPVIVSATFARFGGGLTVTFRNLAVGRVVHVYAGTDQGRTYLGRFVASSQTGRFTLTRAQQTLSGVSGQVFAGAVITGSQSTTGDDGQTSSLSRGFAATSG